MDKNCQGIYWIKNKINGKVYVGQASEKKGILNIFKRNKEAMVVLIFPDNVFKYTTFLTKNFPDIIQVSQPKTQNPMVENLFSEMIQIARNEYNTTNVEEAKKFIERENPEIIDVRPSFIYSQAHIPNAKNIQYILYNFNA